MAGDPQAREYREEQQYDTENPATGRSPEGQPIPDTGDYSANGHAPVPGTDRLVPDARPGNVESPEETGQLLPPPPPLVPTASVNPVRDEPRLLPGDGGTGEPPGTDVAEGSTPHKASSTRVILREIIETGLLALLVFLAVRASFQNFKVDGESMMPTLHNGQFMIVNKLVYAQVDAGQLSRFIPFLNASPHEERDVFHGPQRGDIVVLVNPREPKMDLVKRVIGLPGDTIEILDGHVYINDHLLLEPYIKVVWHYTGPKITIPPNEYFVMGDNRSNSLDSRSQQVGLIPRNLIIGKAMLSYWPLSRFGLAPNASPQLSPTQTTPRIAASAAAGGGT